MISSIVFPKMYLFLLAAVILHLMLRNAAIMDVSPIVEELGNEVATPDEAREILALKGGDRVKF